ncbi:hypothetical protein D3C85_83650 [compost metagenome]
MSSADKVQKIFFIKESDKDTTVLREFVRQAARSPIVLKEELALVAYADTAMTEAAHFSPLTLPKGVDVQLFVVRQRGRTKTYGVDECIIQRKGWRVKINFAKGTIEYYAHAAYVPPHAPTLGRYAYAS